MKVTTPAALARHLQSGKRGGVYFLYGDEEFLKEEALHALVDAHLDPATRDFNYDQVRGSDVTPETLASLVNTPPMMAEWRVVVVREVQAMATNARLRSTLESIVKNPAPDVLLILSAVIPSGRAQFYEKLKKQTIAVEFAALSEADAPDWLIARAAEQGLELQVNAARALASAIGSELGRMVQEIQKLRDYAGDRKTITVEDINTLVGTVPRQNRWDWFDQVGDRRFADARRNLRTLLDSGESGVGLVIGLGTHFLRLALGVSGGQRALETVLPPHQKWLAGRIAKQARQWSTDAAAGALDDLLRADRLLKSASLSDEQVMEELLLRIQARATGAAA